MKKISGIKILVLALLILSLCACQKKKEESNPSIADYPIEHEMEYGGVYIKIAIDDFNALGFSFGDSIDLTFDNGKKLEDIPYYNGYYVDAGEPLLIGYPGYEYIKATINYGQDLWDEFSLKVPANVEGLWKKAVLEEHNTATITLHEKGKYLPIQEASDIHYFDERERYDSDAMFANFRSMNLGKLKRDVIYRSASPCDNQHNRAPYVDALIREAGVNTILDLADNEVKIEKYIARDDFASPYFLSLYDSDQVIPIALNMNYLSDDFGMKIVQGFNLMAEKEGPYLIHCTEGKDRTGFVAMLIEALAKASYKEIEADYMKTYANYYRIDKSNDKEKYQIILERNLDGMIAFMVNDAGIDFKNCDLSIYAENYLQRCGMSEEQIQALKGCLMEK
ncbi:MAG: tyrosine-protein phosphatase [Erysipelotrichaceae bacterium]|nr:tyrosine-protein phosphatase [Erysipelotrichaceae bacterium]MBQ1624616.1 tyrosine-protein phosphatase [Erysipelotrichaceae bacterium]MBQ2584852.1 tyrosine-protein phosphatase [Erysipelotrichaceae bacterium]MBQ5554916.1 tyrosine-protein phosphatase [Erysipelotrichaceae bacterium]